MLAYLIRFLLAQPAAALVTDDRPAIGMSGRNKCVRSAGFSSPEYRARLENAGSQKLVFIQTPKYSPVFCTTIDLEAV
jgi:hypothetical protein